MGGRLFPHLLTALRGFRGPRGAAVHARECDASMVAAGGMLVGPGDGRERGRKTKWN